MTNQTNIDSLRKEMKEEFDKLNTKILLLTEAVNNLTKTTSRMDEHINFVEGSYETLRSPLDFIVSRVNNLRGVSNDNSSLPQIKN